MIAFGSEVMVIPLPPMTIGLNFEELVKSKVVVPAKVTTAPALSFDRSMELFVGAWISRRVIAVHAATAGAI